jgi:hypothetical protein
MKATTIENGFIYNISKDAQGKKFGSLLTGEFIK